MTSCQSSTDDDEPSAPICNARINVDWSQFDQNTPSGMTIMFHHSETGQMTHAIDNNTASTTAGLESGRYWATVFNLTPGEFSNIGFRRLNAVETAEAFAREYDGHKWLTIPSDDNSYVACQPEWLAADTILTTAVEPLPEPQLIGTLHPRNIIHTLHITVTVGNSRAMIAARGAISGMADGQRLSSRAPNSNAVTVTHLIGADSWVRNHDSSLKATVRCFGLPANHKGLPEENIFEFQALLSDSKTVKTYTVPVGHLIKVAALGSDDDLNISLELSLSPALPSVGDSGSIDVWLNDWDESIDVNLPV